MAYSHAWSVGAGCWQEDSIPFVWTSPYSFLSVLMARRLSFPRESHPREKGGCHNALYDLSYVKSHAISPSHSICYEKVTRSSSIQKEKNPFLLFEGGEVWEYKRICRCIFKCSMVARFKLAPQWSSPHNIHTLVYFCPILYHSCSLWPMVYGEVVVCHFWY